MTITRIVLSSATNGFPAVHVYRETLISDDTDETDGESIDCGHEILWDGENWILWQRSLIIDGMSFEINDCKLPEKKERKRWDSSPNKQMQIAINRYLESDLSESGIHEIAEMFFNSPLRSIFEKVFKKDETE